MDLKEIIGKRIKAEREKRGFSQGKLAEALGWNNHQTVVSVESGQREVKAWELAKIAKFLGVNLMDLLEESAGSQNLPFVLWRVEPKENKPEARAKFLKHCEDYYFLEKTLGFPNRISRQLPLLNVNLEEANIEDVEEQANYIRESFNLGHYPAVTLSKTLEDYYGIKFLQFDFGSNAGSAASTKSDFGVCILVNKSEIPWRQNFSVAHELFHLLTWDEKLFKNNEGNAEFNKHNETLANAFAAELLMPEESILSEIRKIAPKKDCQFTDLVIIARKFDVSIKALLTRLESLKLIKTETKEQLLKEPDFKDLDQKSKLKDYCAAKRLGERFIRMAYQAYAREKISRSRLAEMMDVPLGSLKRILEENGLPESANREITLCHS